MPERYSRIYFLVHPLYFPFVGDLEDLRVNFVATKLLGVYGKKVLEVLADPNAYMIIVKPAYEHQLSREPKELRKIKQFESRFLTPLIEFAKKRLGPRIYVTNYDFRYKKTTSSLMPFNFKNIFKSKIRVKSFGEYADYCVESWSDELLELLKQNQITSHFEIEHNASLSISRLSDFSREHRTLWDKLYRPDRLRRAYISNKEKYRPRVPV